jgi:general L-amino acid transport system permease protein
MMSRADRIAGRGVLAASLLNDPRARAIAFQVVLVVAIAAFLYWVGDNTVQNLSRANYARGFGFLDDRAGFDISQTLIPYSIESTYARAFLVGLLNTLLVAVIGIVLATVIGFLIGIARLSSNWLIARLATVYVETLRNIPLLLLLLFWYRAVLSVLPGPRQGYRLPFGANLSNRGLILPQPLAGPEFWLTIVAFAVAVLLVVAVAVWARRRRDRTGWGFPTFRVGLAVLIVLPLVVFLVSGSPLGFEMPELKGFNFVGGVQINPEFLALTVGLSLYTATFIAENVRGGILAVDHGQVEAAYAGGLRRGATLRLVVIPQALRVIVPPLTNQYLNLTKNSSLAAAVGYPDLVAVFDGTVLNQTGQAIECIFLTMLVYLAISLATSLAMNAYNRRIVSVQRRS